MAHQIFGEQENIFGYKDLKINLFYSAGPMDVFYDVKYSKKVDDLESVDVLKADDIDTASKQESHIKIYLSIQYPLNLIISVTEILPEGIPYYTNLQEFLSVMQKKSKSFEPFGEKVHEFTANGRNFLIYLCDMNTPNFSKYLVRLETFLFWYIDAASRIDLDPQWKFFVV